jgi:hypothetical protein
MATINLGRIKPVFRGAYNNSTSYVVDDIVTFGNETFIAIQAGSGNATSNASYWTKLAAKGTDGTDVGTTLTTQGDILYRDGSGLARLAAGTSGQFLKTQGSGANPVWADNTAGWIKHTYYENDTRTNHSDAAHRVMFSFSFTKSEASSILILQGIIPVTGENSDHVGPYGIIDGGGAEPSDDGDHHKGILYIPTSTGNHPGGFIYNQRFTGVSAGSHTFYAGYNPRDGGANQPGTINFNHNEQARNQQTATTFIMQEVSA